MAKLMKDAPLVSETTHSPMGGASEKKLENMVPAADTDEDNVVSMASWRDSVRPTHGAKADSDEIQEEVRHHRKSGT